MSEHSLKNIYRKRHFYKVTWARSEEMLSEVPWLKNEERDYCIVGYRQPTIAEAQDFIADIMYDRLYDKVVRVEEISKQEALETFQMDNWRYQKVFGADDVIEHKPPLSELIHSAKARADISAGKHNVNSKDIAPGR